MVVKCQKELSIQNLNFKDKKQKLSIQIAGFISLE
jgi:hypothetical protein